MKKYFYLLIFFNELAINGTLSQPNKLTPLFFPSQILPSWLPKPLGSYIGGTPGLWFQKPLWLELHTLGILVVRIHPWLSTFGTIWLPVCATQPNTGLLALGAVDLQVVGQAGSFWLVLALHGNGWLLAGLHLLGLHGLHGLLGLPLGLASLHGLAGHHHLGLLHGCCLGHCFQLGRVYGWYLVGLGVSGHKWLQHNIYLSMTLAQHF